jgi:hypothetical protein
MKRLWCKIVGHRWKYTEVSLISGEIRRRHLCQWCGDRGYVIFDYFKKQYGKIKEY